MDRVVVCFRWRGALEAGDSRDVPSFESAAAELLQRRSVLGGRVAAWHARSFAFDFALDAIEDAIELLVGPEGRLSALASFGVGVAQGDHGIVHEFGTDVALATGVAIERATALAWIAEPGDVLLDPQLEVVRSGQLLTSGATLGTSDGHRLRGQRLDLKYPWRRPEAMRCSTRPPLVGPEPSDLETASGQLALLVAPRGCGGTRFLRELAARFGARMLHVRPWQVGEPLGGLRDAFRRASQRGAPSLDEPLVASLRALLAGEGLDTESAGQLVSAWVGDGVVLIDDVGEADRDTLEAVTWACREEPVRVVARVLDQGHLPSILGELPRAGMVILGPLDPDEGEAIVRASTVDPIDETAVARWARRGGGRPLAILEAVRFGIESVELVHEHDSVIPRNRVAGRGGPQPARHWIIGRMRFLEEDARAALDALLILGGQASGDELEAFLAAAGVEVNSAVIGTELRQAGWVDVDDTAHLSLSSATLRDVLHEVLSIERRTTWHAAAARLRSKSSMPVAVAQAALHGFMAGDLEFATESARRAAAATRAAGLNATAEAFDQLATTGDVSLVMARGLFGGISPRRPSRPSMAPRGLGGPSLHVEGTVARAGEDGLPGQAAEALRRGDLQAVGDLAAQLRGETQNEPLAERLEAMACLRRGEVAEALRLLRAAKTRAQELDVEERCRAALAFGVALSMAGRHAEALLEALEALARAREVGDASGERACARFLAQLTELAGHHEYARSWRALAE
jgi:hypothetical protein